jgi:aminoglycoside 3-N-acetyltransferase I
MQEIQVIKLAPSDRETAKKMFTVMAKVFGEDCTPLGDGYVDRLLGSDGFWAFAAIVGDDVVGGVTAHTLPMTKAEICELLIYDIAVAEPHQRKGVGRKLVTALLEFAVRSGIRDVFVPVDNGDAHALDFYYSLGGKPSSVTLFSFSVPRNAIS